MELPGNAFFCILTLYAYIKEEMEIDSL